MSGLDPSAVGMILMAILSLAFLEGLLSADNALVLAVMVRHLPKEQQKRALRYGIIGAFVFRLIGVVFAATLLEYWGFKAVGGAYLLYLAVRHMLGGEDSHLTDTKPRIGKSFWGTVLGVELADIAFSVDSILAGVAMAEGLPKRLQDINLLHIPGINFELTLKLAIVYLGGILGIVAMRFVAGYFIILLDRFNGLAAGAYYLVAWIGLKLLGEGIHHALHPPVHPEPGGWREIVPAWVTSLPLEMHALVFWFGMLAIVVTSMILSGKPAEGPRIPKDLLEGEPESAS